MIDLIFFVLFLYLVLVGAYRGFIELFIKAIGFAVGVAAGIKYSEKFASFLSSYFHSSPAVLNFFSFSLIAVFIFSLSFLVYFFVKRIFIKKKRFGLWDRIVGASGGALIFLIIVAGLSYYSEKNRLVNDLTKSSKIISILKR
ncbi:MAG TPA: CvpA family protein [Persephonella sp.]|nr:CvpA family protein [Persephonella sp.]